MWLYELVVGTEVAAGKCVAKLFRRDHFRALSSGRIHLLDCNGYAAR